VRAARRRRPPRAAAAARARARAGAALLAAGLAAPGTERAAGATRSHLVSMTTVALPPAAGASLPLPLPEQQYLCTSAHCASCISPATCRAHATSGSSSSDNRCAVERCPSCAVLLHRCKLADHLEICTGAARACPCAQWGCAARYTGPAELAQHLQRCWAAPVVCYLCSRMCRRCDLGPHIEQLHREHAATFEHCPLRLTHGCEYCVVRQQPSRVIISSRSNSRTALLCGSTSAPPAPTVVAVHHGLLRAVARDARGGSGGNLGRLVRWQQRSQPAHLVVFLQRMRGAADHPCRHQRSLVHTWSNAPSPPRAAETATRPRQQAPEHTQPTACTGASAAAGGASPQRRPHLGGGAGREQRSLSWSSTTQAQALALAPALTPAFPAAAAAAAAVAAAAMQQCQPCPQQPEVDQWPLHGFLCPPPLPVSDAVVAAAAAAAAVGARSAGGLPLTMSHVHEETMGGGVRPWQLADLPQELLYRVLDWVWPDGISLSALKGSCKQFRGVVAEYCPQLLSLRWKRCHSTDGGKSDPEEGARVDQACTPHRPTRWGWQASVGPVGSVGIQPTGQQGPREVMDEDGDEGRVGTPPVRCADDVRWGMSSAGASAASLSTSPPISMAAHVQVCRAAHGCNSAPPTIWHDQAHVRLESLSDDLAHPSYSNT
jgi:hypothetical protein